MPMRDVVARHPLKVVTAALFLLVAGLVVVITRDDVPPPEPAVPAPVDAGPAAPVEDAAEVLAELEKKPVTTKKGKLLKDQMKKRLRASANDGKGKTGSSPSGTNVAAAGALVVALAGDGELRRGFGKKLRGVRVTDERSAPWLVSLTLKTGEAGGGVIYAKCSAAMSELPARKLVGALSARADVSGDGSDDDELKRAAVDACASSLAEDVAKWVRARR